MADALVTNRPDDLEEVEAPDGPFIVVMRTAPGHAFPELAALHAKHLHRMDICVVNLADDQGIEVLDEDAMRDAGWVRA